MMVKKGETNCEDEDVGLLDDPCPRPALVLSGLLLLLLSILELVVSGTLQCNMLILSINQLYKCCKAGCLI